MDITERLSALANGPKPWLVRTVYVCGKVRELRQPREAMARNHAEREARKIGKRLIDRETGATVTVARVTVEYAPTA